jgi:hypothetical protein
VHHLLDAPLKADTAAVPSLDGTTAVHVDYAG